MHKEYKVFNPFKILAWALTLILTLIGSAYLFSHFTGGWSTYWGVLSELSLFHWALIFLGTLVFYLLDFIRFYSLLAILGVNLPFRTGLKLAPISYFVSSLTPVSELHLPVMVYILSREGIQISKATAASLTKSLYMVLWICIFSFVSLKLQKDEMQLPQGISDNLSLYLTPLFALIIFLISIAMFPESTSAWSKRRLSHLPTDHWARRTLTNLNHFASTLASIVNSRSYFHILAHTGSIAFVVVYASIGYTLASGLGIEISFQRAIAVFSNSLLIAYVAPVPGSIGITELTTQFLLDPQMQNKAMIVALTQRILCWYIVIPIGMFFCLSSLRGFRFPSGHDTH